MYLFIVFAGLILHTPPPANRTLIIIIIIIIIIISNTIFYPVIKCTQCCKVKNKQKNKQGVVYPPAGVIASSQPTPVTETCAGNILPASTDPPVLHADHPGSTQRTATFSRICKKRSVQMSWDEDINYNRCKLLKLECAKVEEEILKIKSERKKIDLENVKLNLEIIKLQEELKPHGYTFNVVEV